MLMFAFAGATYAEAQESPESVGKIEIREIEWGFDGKAQSHAFVPLSLLIENTGPTPASGSLRLAKIIGLKNRIDAEFEQTYFISGFSSRWVQLTPFVAGDFENWQLTWGPEFRNRVDVPSPRIGERATVLIADADDVTAAGSALRRCDPALFPASVTGTDGLRGVVLHAVPNWQGARVQAFREWLQRGGRVYLVHGEDDKYARFPGELAFLNDEREQFAVGAGRVTRIPMPLDDIDAETARRLILTDPEEKPEDLVETDPRRLAASYTYTTTIWQDFNDFIFRELQRTTRFHRNWWLVYFAAVLYVLAVYPGSYWLGRRVADWRWFYAGFLGISVVFSAGFSWLGQLGSADRSRTRTVAAAYQLEEGLYDVTQWTCAASRNGDLYQITNPGSGRLFSSCQEIEAVNGVVRLQDGRFDLDMPSASTCNILQRARLAGPALGVRAESLQVDSAALRTLKITWGEGVYDRQMVVAAWYRESVYQLNADEEGAQLAGMTEHGSTFIGSLDRLPFQPPSSSFYNPWLPLGAWSYDRQPSSTEVLKMLMQPATGATLQLPETAMPKDVALDPSLVRLLIYRPLPEEFEFAGDEFPDQFGYALYIIDLPVAATRP